MLTGLGPTDAFDLVRQNLMQVRRQATLAPAIAGERNGLRAGADSRDQAARPGGDQSLRDAAQRTAEGESGQPARDAARDPTANQSPSSRADDSPTELTPEEEQQVRELKKRDREVRQHEQAHARAAGQYGGQPQYSYVRGPDGKQYAVSGSVKIDTSEENSPEATVRKMEVVIRAALAPADPSSADRQIAASARQKKAEAQAEIRAERQEEQRDAIRRQQESTEDPSQAGLPRSVTEQAVSAYASAQNLLSDPPSRQGGFNV